MPTKAKVHDVFKNRINDLVENAEGQAKAAMGDGPRPWQVPQETEADSLLDVPNLHKPAFDREDPNTNYGEAIGAAETADGAGTLGDVVSLKYQIAYVAAEERAFRLRHATPVRCLTHAVCSREGHGNPKGIFGGVQKMAEDAIRAGSVTGEGAGDTASA